MALLRSWLGAAVLASALIFAAPSARAGTGDISFCNEFPHKLYIAIAYVQTDVNNYLSRGWLETRCSGNFSASLPPSHSHGSIQVACGGQSS